VRIWRIARRPFQALDGEGARLYGGRWNSAGVAVVYASSTLALAALEYLVHLDIEDAPDDLVALALELPDDAPIERMSADELPDGWHTTTEHAACAERGDGWARRGESLALRVPSAVIVEEENVLLNPAHPAMRHVKVVAVRDFSYDARLLG
jgi:RES domain-containing protein